MNGTIEVKLLVRDGVITDNSEYESYSFQSAITPEYLECTKGSAFAMEVDRGVSGMVEEMYDSTETPQKWPDLTTGIHGSLSGRYTDKPRAFEWFLRGIKYGDGTGASVDEMREETWMYDAFEEMYGNER